MTSSSRVLFRHGDGTVGLDMLIDLVDDPLHLIRVGPAVMRVVAHRA
jgi:hypothetical protein